MTDIVKLFSGIGVIIDEAIDDNQIVPNGIQKILQSIKSKHIPVLVYKDLPDDDEISKLHSISFLILDWNLSGIHPIPEATINDNINFIRHLKESCFAPVFIFSDESPHDIQVKLEESGLYTNNCPIFIKKKDELDTTDNLFSEIENWLRNTPSIYILKEWDMATREAKTQMLWTLSSIHPSWPAILTKAIQEDGSDEPYELMRLLQNNLSYRLKCPQLEADIIESEIDNIGKDDLRSILECERFVPDASLPDLPFAGDIYFMEDRYYLNIRPDCDIIRSKTEADMYLLKGKIVDEAKINSDDLDSIKFDSGEFLEKNNCCYVAFVQSNILCFSLRDIKIKKWKKIKDNRIGRLLPPFITKIQQKYAAYLQRQGLPSIPYKAIKDIEVNL
jgi:hypothetical protein